MDIDNLIKENKHRLDMLAYIQGCGGDMLTTIIGQDSPDYADTIKSKINKLNRWDSFVRKEGYGWVNIPRQLIFLETDGGEKKTMHKPFASWDDEPDYWKDWGDFANIVLTWEPYDFEHWCNDKYRILLNCHYPPMASPELFKDSKMLALNTIQGDTEWEDYRIKLSFIKNRCMKINSSWMGQYEGWLNVFNNDNPLISDKHKRQLKKVLDDGGWLYEGAIHALVKQPEHPEDKLPKWYNVVAKSDLSDINSIDFLWEYAHEQKIGTRELNSEYKKWRRHTEGFRQIELKDVIHTDLIAEEFNIDKNICNKKIRDWHINNLKLINDYGI